MIFPRLNRLLLLTISLFNIISFTSQSEQTSYRAVIVSSYHQEFETQRNMIQTLKSDLLANTKIQTLYMDSKRVEAPLLEKTSQHILSFVKNFSPDIIFLCDDNALKYLGEQLLLQGHQVVFLGINENPRYYVDANQFYNLKGVLERPLYLRGILELRAFYPLAEKVTILMDSTETSNVIKKEVFGSKTSVNLRNIQTNYKQISTFQQLQEFILALNSQSQHQLFLTTMFNLIDNNTGRNMSNDMVLSWLAENYNRPIFSFWQTKVKEHRILAAYGISEEAQGHAAAKIGNALLLNQPVEHFITPDKGKIFISQQQLNKFNLKITDDYIKRNSILFK